MTDRIRDFLRLRRPEGPCLVVDLDVVRENYSAFAKALPDSRVFYAVKANPEAPVLKLLAELGSSFDCASVAEIDMAFAAGATADPRPSRPEPFRPQKIWAKSPKIAPLFGAAGVSSA